MNSEKRNILACQAVASQEGVSFVYADFIEMAKFTNVLVDMPGENNLRMKLVNEHTFLAPEDCDNPNPEDLKTVEVGNHYNQIDFFEGKPLARNFFVDEDFDLSPCGEKFLATVKVVKKINFNRDKEESLILDIADLQPVGNEIPKTATWRLRFGRPEGTYQIPGTTRFVVFNRMNGGNAKPEAAKT